MSTTHIFGASGFVGRTLTPMLQQQGLKYQPYSSKQLDLCDPASITTLRDTIKDGDRVLMLSALTPEKGKAPELTLRNIAMMQHLLAGIEGRNIAQFIYVSSDAVYPITADMVDELTPTNPTELYGQMHVLRECYAKAAIPSEKLAILRPCAIYGVGDTHNAYGINRFLKSARESGEIALFGEGEEYRDHIHVEDVARIILATLQQNMHGTFNLASGQSWCFGEIASYIAANIDRDVRIIHKPRALPTVTHRHMNIAKLLRSISPAPRSIETGLRSLLQQEAAAA